MTSTADLSRMLWEARELLDMYADIVDVRYPGVKTNWPRRVARKIDVYRVEQGWNRHGFGGET